MMAAAKAFIDQNLEQWVIIATAYVGTQGFVDVVGRFKGK